MSALFSSRRYAWFLVVLLSAALAINFGLSLYGLSILNVHMGDDLGLTRGVLGAAFSVFTFMTGFPGPLVAKLIDRFGIRFTLIVGNSMLVIGGLAMAALVSGPVGAVVVSGVILGLANVVGGPITVQASVTRWFSRRRSLAMSLVISGSSIGGILFPPMLERAVAATGSWQAGWLLVAAFGGAITLLVALLLKERPGDIGQLPDGEFVDAPSPMDEPTEIAPASFSRVYQTDEEWTQRDVIRAPAFWALLFCSIGVSAVFAIFLGQGVLHMRDLGFSTEDAAYLVSLSVALGLGVRIATGYVGDRIDPKLLWAVALIFQCVGMALFARATSEGLLYLSVFCIGIGDSIGILSLIMVFSNWFGEKAAPFVFGYGSVFSAAFGALAPMVAGYCFDTTGSYAPVYYGVAVLCAVSAVVILLLQPPRLLPVCVEN